MSGLDHHRADQARVELEDDVQIRALRRRLRDPTRNGYFGRGDEVVCGLVPVTAVPQQYLLAALGDDAKSRKEHAMLQPCGRGCAIEK